MTQLLQYLVLLSNVNLYVASYSLSLVQRNIYERNVHSDPFYLKKEILFVECRNIRSVLQTVTESSHSDGESISGLCTYVV